MARPATDPVLPPAPDPATSVPPWPRERRARRRQVALAVLSGLLYVAAFPGYGVWPLALVAFVPLLVATRATGLRRTVWLGALAGFTSHVGGYYWVAHMLREFAQAPWPLAILGCLAVAAGQGASFGVGLGLARWLAKQTGWPFAVTLAVGLAAMDFAYPLVFPSYVANTLFGATWLMQTADVWGVVGLTALVGAVNGALGDALLARLSGQALPRRALALTAAAALSAVVYGGVRVAQVDAQVAAAPKLKVGLVQTNVGGFENTLGRAQSVRRYTTATRALHEQGVDLVVWPEGALRNVVEVGADIRGPVLDGMAQALLFGATRVGADRHGERVPYNSAFLADATGRVLASYDKTVLLVFGEYVPGGDWFPQIYRWLPMASHWGRGVSTDPLVLGDWRLGTFICYEDILPRFVDGLMQPTGGRRPDLMVNVTNDSWYGDTVEPLEHLALASFRTVEHRRALVRSTNTGISALVDPVGRVVAKTRTYREELLVGEVPKMSGTTVYEALGDVAGWGSLGLLAGVFARSRRRRAPA